MPIKVLLVGINYLMNKDDILKSPINNIEILNDFLISYIGVDKKNIVMLSDSPNYKNATFFNISTTLKNMTETSIP